MEAEEKRHSLLFDLVTRLVKEKPLGTLGGVIALVVFISAIFAEFVAPYPPVALELTNRLLPPSAEHWMGTDSLGRDLFSRIVFGARVSMIVGLGAPAIGMVVATIIGGISGYIGGKYDMVVQRFIDAWMSFPGLILYLTIMAVIGAGLLQVVLVLGISGGIGSSRIIRGAVIGIKENVYVEAARAIGTPVRGILIRHILPNIMPVVIVIFSTGIAWAILAEAAISFLGFGVPPPTPSWGGMLSGPGRQYMLEAPWLALWPGLVLSVVVYSVNMLGDAVRDILDPRLRGGLGRYTRGKGKKRTRGSKSAPAQS